MHHDFDGMTDEEIALLAQQGDADASEYLLNKYKNFVRSKARSYFLVGADHEDIVQEGMIGLFKAFRDFRPDKLASFHAFAEICVTRQIITAIKTATRQKHIPLNSYVSLNKPIYEEESDRTLMDVITEGRSADPEELLIGRESYVSIESRIDEALSPLERRVLAASRMAEREEASRLALYSRWPMPSRPVSSASKSAGDIPRRRDRIARSQADANTGARPAASSAA